MKVYPDHNLVSGIVKEDLPGKEVDALATILQWHREGRIDLRKSRVHDRELEPYRDVERKPQINDLLSRFAEVPFVEDHELKGFHSMWDQHGGITWPQIEDDPICRGLWDLGLSRTDAHHLMVAVRAACDAFLTCDERTILNRREKIESQLAQIHQIRLMKPSNFVEQVIQDEAGKVIWSAP